MPTNLTTNLGQGKRIFPVYLENPRFHRFLRQLRWKIFLARPLPRPCDPGAWRSASACECGLLFALLAALLLASPHLASASAERPTLAVALHDVLAPLRATGARPCLFLSPAQARDGLRPRAQLDHYGQRVQLGIAVCASGSFVHRQPACLGPGEDCSNARRQFRRAWARARLSWLLLAATWVRGWLSRAWQRAGCSFLFALWHFLPVLLAGNQANLRGPNEPLNAQLVQSLICCSPEPAATGLPHRSHALPSGARHTSS